MNEYRTEVAPTQENTNHNATERKSREDVIRSIGGDGNPIARFYWDRGHQNGAEWHTLTDNGIIIINNVFTGKLITKLIARPGQIIRYKNLVNELNEKTRKMKNWIIPQRIINIARKHESEGLNYS